MPPTRRAWRGAGVATFGFVLVSTMGRPWTLFERGPYTADFLDVQARAIAHGRLDVPASVAGIEGFRVGSETHLYFGVVPALGRLPLTGWTDAFDGRLGLVSMALAVLVGALATGRLVRRGADAVGGTLPGWAPDAAAAVYGLATPLLWLGSRSVVYHEVELWGASLSLAGIERALRWRESGRRRDLGAAALMALLAFNTRASSGVAPAVALGLFGLAELVRRRDVRRALPVLVAAAVPVIAYMAVNTARFGSPVSVPFEDQVFTALSPERRAMLAETGGGFFSLAFLPTTLVQYLRPDALRLDVLFPFVEWGPRATVIGSPTFDTVDRAASITTAAPVLVAAAFGLRPSRVPARWWIVIAAALASVAPTLLIGFVAQRYLADLVPLFVLLACVGAPRVLGRRSGRVLLTALAGVGLVTNVALAVTAHHLYVTPTASDAAGFLEVRYDLHDRVPGGPPPDVVVVEQLPAAAPDGTVAAVGDCDGLYVSTGEGWNRVELRPGGAFHAVLRGDPGPGTVVEGDGWRVTLEGRGGRPTLVYHGGDTEIVGAALTDGDGRLVVTADPVSQGVVVDDGDDHELLFAHLLPSGGPLRAGPRWTSSAGSAPVCEELVGRLDGA